MVTRTSWPSRMPWAAVRAQRKRAPDGSLDRIYSPACPVTGPRVSRPLLAVTSLIEGAFTAGIVPLASRACGSCCRTARARMDCALPVAAPPSALYSVQFGTRGLASSGPGCRSVAAIGRAFKPRVSNWTEYRFLPAAAQRLSPEFGRTGDHSLLFATGATALRSCARHRPCHGLASSPKGRAA